MRSCDLRSEVIRLEFLLFPCLLVSLIAQFLNSSHISVHAVRLKDFGGEQRSKGA